MSERKSRVRLDSESDKQVMVEDHSPQHGQQSVTDVAKVVAAETATEATLIAVTETATGDASDAPAEGSTGDSSASGNDGEPPNNIKPSWVSALYRSMGILFRGRNTSQLKECLPGLEIREPDIQLLSNGLSFSRCNDETEHENTEDCIEADWIMVSEEDAACSTSIVHEAIPRATSDTGNTIHHKVKVSQPTATHQGQSLHIDNMDHADMPFDTGGRDGDYGNGGSTSACGIQGDNQEIRLGNRVKESTTPHDNRHLGNGGDSNMTWDAVNGVYTPSRQGTEVVEMQQKHLLEQWKKIDQRDQAIVKELLNNVIFHARNQPEGLRTLLPMLRMMSRDIAPGVPVHHNEIDDSYVRLLIFELTDIGCDLSRKTATNVVSYILTIGRNNPKLLLEIMEKMDHLDNISNHRIPDR
ncbi:uncharacterized protein [Haliotis asinina]|uniref:uncharacterized protein n=1 Tax=Haliotis asinina TaxID=109174 RepID=UPI003531AC16